MSPDGHLDQALKQIDRPVFQQMARPLPGSCAVLTASSVDEVLHDARKFRGFLKSDVLQRDAERVE